MTHDLVRRYRRMVARFDAKLTQAIASGDANAIGAATAEADAARAALLALDQDVSTIEWANALRGTS